MFNAREPDALVRSPGEGSGVQKPGSPEPGQEVKSCPDPTLERGALPPPRHPQALGLCANQEVDMAL